MFTIKKITILFITVFTLFLCSCSRSKNQEMSKDCVVWRYSTKYEDGMFYEAESSPRDTVLCYYSKTDDRSAVICGMPECTHISKTSPDCTALIHRGEAAERDGVNRIGDKLY